MKTDNIEEAASIISEALQICFISPNVSDSNMEAANVVDSIDEAARGLFAIAKSIDKLTLAIIQGKQ